MVFVVETEDLRPNARQFMGGWRNKIIGAIYYNACTQTGGRGRDTRDSSVQTEFLVDKFTDVQRDEAVQVHFFPDVRDRFARPGNIRSRDSTRENEDTALDKKLLDSVVKIQRFYRSHRGRFPTVHPPSVSPSPPDPENRGIPSESPSHRSADFVILNRRSPRTRSDFELLHNLLDRWRILETGNASSLLFEPSRIALCSLILSKEVELLRAIDSMKAVVRLKRRERRSRNFLDELSKSALWSNGRGKTILVDTPGVQRARALKETYDDLSKEDSSSSERLDVLKRLREIVGMHTCRESYDLIYLIDQEIDLLTRSVDESKLKWLRNRMKISFLRFARDSLSYDLESDRRYLEVGAKVICKTCGRLLPIEKFSCEKRVRSSTCNYCLYLKASKEPRVVYEPYARLLRDVKRFEARMKCYASLAFVIDCKIVYHLVNDIWHGRSGISDCDNFDELTLVRFRNDAEWSPWNCLLLTATEASVHRRVDDVDRFYGSMLLQKFRTKNLQAKIYFKSVLKACESS